MAAPTVLRAWHVSRKWIALPPLGSYEVWSRRVREALVWLGQIDPCETLTDVRNSDPHRDALIAVLKQWEMCLGVANRYTVQEVIDHALSVSSFHTALMAVAASRNGQLVSNISLGRWLKQVEGRPDSLWCKAGTNMVTRSGRCGADRVIEVGDGKGF